MQTCGLQTMCSHGFMDYVANITVMNLCAHITLHSVLFDLLDGLIARFLFSLQKLASSEGRSCPSLEEEKTNHTEEEDHSDDDQQVIPHTHPVAIPNDRLICVDNLVSSYGVIVEDGFSRVGG